MSCLAARRDVWQSLHLLNNTTQATASKQKAAAVAFEMGGLSHRHRLL